MKDMAQDNLGIDISFRDEHPQDLRTALAGIGAVEFEEVPQRGIVGTTCLFVGIIALGQLVNLVGKVLRLWKCGVVVDARGPKILVEKNCDMPHGTVLVFNKKGTQAKLHEPSEHQLEKLLQMSSLRS